MIPRTPSPSPASGRSDPSLDAIEEWVAACIERIDREGPQAVEILCRENPERAEELRRRILRLQQAGVLGSDFRQAPQDTPGGTGPESNGSRKLGQYSILRELGRGGMGVVYLAKDERLGRAVALKILPRYPGSGGRAHQRFEREIRALASLHHPNIVPVYDGGVIDGVAYCAMEYVEGNSLARMIRALISLDVGTPELDTSHLALAHAERDDEREQRPAEVPERVLSGPRPALPDTWGRSYVEAICRVVVQVARALQHAHEHGIVHRDVKPSNVLVQGDGTARLIDFGLAHVESEARLTMTGDFAGTPCYVAPEQVQDDNASVTVRTDVYALGVTLYELLTLRVPFQGKSAQDVLRQIVSRDPQLPRSLNARIPRDLETICLTAMEKNPARRYGSAAELADDLGRFLDFRPIKARPIGPTVRLARFVRRNPALSCTIALGFTLLVGGPFGYGLHQHQLALEQEQFRKKIQAESDRTGKVLDFILNTLAPADPMTIAAAGWTQSNSDTSELSAVELIDRAAPQIDAGFAGAADLQGELHEAFGRIYSGLGSPTKAENELSAALRLKRQQYGEDSLEVAAAEHELGVALRRAGELEGSVRCLLKAREARERRLGDPHRLVADSIHELGVTSVLLQNRQGDQLLQEALDQRIQVLGEDDLDTAETLSALGTLECGHGRYSLGLGYLDRALKVFRAHLSDAHPRTALILANKARGLEGIGDYAGAEPLLRRSLDQLSSALPDGHGLVAWIRRDLSDLCYYRGEYAEAEANYRAAIADTNNRIGNAYSGSPLSLWELANIVSKLGRYDEAEALYRQAIALYEKDPAEARSKPPGILGLIGKTYEARGDLATAEEYYCKSEELSRPVTNEYPVSTGTGTVWLARAMATRGDYANAEFLCRATMAAAQHRNPDGGYFMNEGTVCLSEFLPDVGRADEAECLLRARLENGLRLLSPRSTELARSKSLLGAVLERKGRFAEAEPLLLEGYEGLRDQLAPAHGDSRLALERIITLYSAWGRPQDVAEYRAYQSGPGAAVSSVPIRTAPH